MVIIFFIITICTVIIFEYHSHCNLLPFRFYKLDENKLNELGFKCISKNKTKLSYIATYQYKKISLKVYRQRFTPLNIIGTAEIYKDNKKICNYSQLPKSFRTSLYATYIQIKYPKTWAKIIKCKSNNQNTKYINFCKKEKLLNYPGIEHEKNIE